jgi:hypothetical protein
MAPVSSAQKMSISLLRVFVVGETPSPQSCYTATAVLLPPVYTTVTWQWVYMMQYLHDLFIW